MSRRKDKKYAERRHTKRRISERFGIEVGDATLDELLKKIRSNLPDLKGEPLSCARSLWTFNIHGFPMKLVYDKHRKEFVTAMRIEEDPLGIQF